jgi:hypothetical protein
MHHSGADGCWSRASMAQFTAMQQNMAGIRIEARHAGEVASTD